MLSERPMDWTHRLFIYPCFWRTSRDSEGGLLVGSTPRLVRDLPYLVASRARPCPTGSTREEGGEGHGSRSPARVVRSHPRGFSTSISATRET